jgi:hypothetical protein
MAKLSAHGKEIGRINYTTYSKAYMQDGTILKNSGFGWKVFGEVQNQPAGGLREGIDPSTRTLSAKDLALLLTEPTYTPLRAWGRHGNCKPPLNCWVTTSTAFGPRYATAMATTCTLPLKRSSTLSNSITILCTRQMHWWSKSSRREHLVAVTNNL